MKRGCGNCGSTALKTLDGAQVGGMPGLQYTVCDGCGWSRAITTRPRREKLREPKPVKNVRVGFGQAVDCPTCHMQTEQQRLSRGVRLCMGCGKSFTIPRRTTKAGAR